MISIQPREMEMLIRVSKSTARQFPDGAVRVTISPADWKMIQRLGRVLEKSSTYTYHQRQRGVPVPPPPAE